MNEFEKNSERAKKAWNTRRLQEVKSPIKKEELIDDVYMNDFIKALKLVKSVRDHRTYVRKLERVIGDAEIFVEKISKSVSDEVSKMIVKPTILNSTETKKYLDSLAVGRVKDGNSKRSVVTIWSDHHFGTNFKKEELGGQNEFNWAIGARRLGMLAQEVATFKVEKRALHEELVILKLGDNIGGLIHNQEGPNYDLMIHQVCGTINYYVQAINYLLAFYPSIKIVAQPGNHARVQHKSSKERALVQKYDSFENIIFYSLSQVFSKNDRVKIDVSMAPFSETLIQGHRIYSTHGDTVFTTGNVGKSINLQSLEQKINAINAEELAKSRDAFEMFCTGHVHHPVVTQTASGVNVSINGSLIGTDVFAHGIGIQSSNPVQLMWETTRKYVQGDYRFVHVNGADTTEGYEKIIHPYNYELSA